MHKIIVGWLTEITLLLILLVGRQQPVVRAAESNQYLVEALGSVVKSQNPRIPIFLDADMTAYMNKRAGEGWAFVQFDSGLNKFYWKK